MKITDEREKNEIRKMYRQAKNKTQQIKILAQLYDTSRAEILSVIDTLPFEEMTSKQERAVRMYISGASHGQIAEELGITHGTCVAWTAIAAAWVKSRRIKDKACPNRTHENQKNFLALKKK